MPEEVIDALCQRVTWGEPFYGGLGFIELLKGQGRCDVAGAPGDVKQFGLFFVLPGSGFGLIFELFSDPAALWIHTLDQPIAVPVAMVNRCLLNDGKFPCAFVPYRFICLHEGKTNLFKT